LATAVLLATKAKILLAPAMNAAMWANKATQRNLKTLIADGVSLVGPNAGEMAESGEAGVGRMAEPLEIVAAIETLFNRGVESALPVDAGIFAAAVADWGVAQAGAQKLKKEGGGPRQLELVENPDILARVSKLKTKRPRLVIGFAAETEKVVEHATAKLWRK